MKKKYPSNDDRSPEESRSGRSRPYRRAIPRAAELLYADELFIVVNKPPGVCLDVPWDDEPTVIDQLERADILSPGEVPVPLYLLEPRLSGVAVLARSREALVVLAAQVEGESFEMRCMALVRGRVTEPCGEISAAVAPRGKGETVLKVAAEEGSAAVTKWQRLDSYVGMAQVECIPQPPDPNIIRLHLHYAGMPLLVDQTYGGGTELRLSHFKAGYRPSARHPERPLIDRVSLHVRSITLDHPTNGRRLTFEAAQHKDFRAALHQLDRFGRLPP